METLSSQLTLEYVKAIVQDIETNLQPTEEDFLLTEKLLTSAEMIMSRMSTLSPNLEQGKVGGVMAIARSGENPFFAVQKIGEVDIKNPAAENDLDKDKLNKYAAYAICKGAVLVQNEDYSFSRENMGLPLNERIGDREVPGGAIRVNDLIVSFSALSMEDDECVALATCVEAGLITLDDSLAMAEQMDNTRYAAVVDTLLH